MLAIKALFGNDLDLDDESDREYHEGLKSDGALLIWGAAQDINFIRRVLVKLK